MSAAQTLSACWPGLEKPPPSKLVGAGTKQPFPLLLPLLLVELVPELPLVVEPPELVPLPLPLLEPAVELPLDPLEVEGPAPEDVPDAPASGTRQTSSRVSHTSPGGQVWLGSAQPKDVTVGRLSGQPASAASAMAASGRRALTT
jgi:hypothetical protein